jgi:hypothetical protein
MHVAMHELLRRSRGEVVAFLHEQGFIEEPSVSDKDEGGNEKWKFNRIGLELHFRGSTVTTVILRGVPEEGFEPYPHDPLPSLSWGIKRERVLDELGQPTKRSDGADSFLIKVDPWLRYDKEQCCTRFQFAEGTLELQQVTFMTPEAAPGLTSFAAICEQRAKNEENHARRIQAYSTVLGIPNERLFDNSRQPDQPQVDVLVFPPVPARSFFTLITSGMSDEPMYVDDNSPSRAEIILYAAEPKEEYSAWMHWAAEFPFVDKTSLDHGHTIEWPEPLFVGSELSAFLFLYTIVRSDQEMCRDLFVGGDPVHLLWFVPITRAELEFKRERGLGELLDMFDAWNHPVVLDEKRASYV